MLPIVFIVFLVLVQNGLAIDDDVQETVGVDLSKYVDIRMRIFINQHKASDLKGMVNFLQELSNVFLVGRDPFGPMICVQFEENDNSIWRHRVDIPKDLTRSIAEDFVNKIDTARQEKRQDDECKKNDQRRPGAHLVQIRFEDRSDKPPISFWDWSHIINAMRKNDEVALISVKGFKQRYFPLLFVDTRSPGGKQALTWYDEHSLIFDTDASKLVTALRKELESLIADCRFSINATKAVTTCYFIRDGYCGYDTAITRADKQQTTMPPVANANPMKFCYAQPSFTTDERCPNSSICADECQQQLRDVPCPTACGPQKRELSKTDVRTKFCPSIACEPKPCVDEVKKKQHEVKIKQRGEAGLALMIVGAVLVIGSGIGLGVLYFLTGGFKKKRRGGFIKSGPVIIVGKMMKKKKHARKSPNVSPDPKSPSGPSSKTARAAPGSKSDRGGLKKKSLFM